MECTSLPNYNPQATPAPVPTAPATFYLYQVTVVTADDPKARSSGKAVSRKTPNFNENPGTNPLKHCSAIEADTDLLDNNNRAIKADVPYYPWPEQSFTTPRDGQCGKSLNLKKNGNDYDFYEGSKQVGVCTKAGDRSDFYFDWWSTTATQVYACTGAC